MNQITSPSLRDLPSAIDRVYRLPLEKIKSRLSRVSTSTDCRKFLVNRMGSTGSTWLAKLLNSHADVFCSHERVVSRIYPAHEYGEDEILRFIDSLANETAHGAYHAMGDVGSVWTGHVAYLSSFTTAILVRHPARILYTRLQIFPQDRSFSGIPPLIAQILRELWGLNLYDFEPIDQMFLNDLVVFASQVWAMDKIDILMRIEDLRGIEYCQRVLHALTGVRYSPGLILNANRSRVNRRTSGSRPIAEVVSCFSKRQREWYGEVLADAGPFFGYNLWNDDLTDAPIPHASPESALVHD